MKKTVQIDTPVYNDEQKRNKHNNHAITTLNLNTQIQV